MLTPMPTSFWKGSVYAFFWLSEYAPPKEATVIESAATPLAELEITAAAAPAKRLSFNAQARAMFQLPCRWRLVVSNQPRRPATSCIQLDPFVPYSVADFKSFG